MAVDSDAVRGHIRRALALHDRVPDALSRLTKAFRLLQAERRDPALAMDESLAAAEGYLFARQAVAGNAVGLIQMLTLIADPGFRADTRQRVSLHRPESTAGDAPGLSQDCVGWGVAGAVQGERDRLIYLPQSVPPSFKPAFGAAGTRTTPRCDRAARRDAS